MVLAVAILRNGIYRILLWLTFFGKSFLLNSIFLLFVFQNYFDIMQSLQAGTESVMKQRYKSHNLYVKSAVPEEDLLIWNVKEGWEPLCRFLGKTIPEEPFPHDNKTGDMEYIDKYAHKSDFFQRKGR